MQDLVKLKQTLEPDVARARALDEAEFVVSSPGEESVAAEVLKALHAEIKTLEKRRKDITDPLNTALKSVKELFEEPLAYLNKAKLKVQTAMSAYRTLEERRKEALLEKAVSSATDDAYREIIHAATAPTATLQGVRETTDYEIEVLDPAAVPEAYKIVDLVALKRAIRAHSGNVEIPGVRFTTVKKLSPTGR